MKKRFFLVMAMVLSITGCVLFQSMIQKPMVEFDSVSMKDMSLFDCTAMFRFRVTNPNSINLNIESLCYRLRIDGRDFIKGDFRAAIHLPANAAQAVELPIHINYLEFFRSIAEVSQKDTHDYDISGTVDLGLFNVPYSHQGTLALPRLPKVLLKNSSIRTMP
jgi:LEA14-like dessication related protein